MNLIRKMIMSKKMIMRRGFEKKKRKKEIK
jgi:hypothetical protein